MTFGQDSTHQHIGFGPAEKAQDSAHHHHLHLPGPAEEDQDSAHHHQHPAHQELCFKRQKGKTHTVKHKLLPITELLLEISKKESESYA